METKQNPIKNVREKLKEETVSAPWSKCGK